MGLMMEGLDYNPVIYEFVTDMMWENKVPDLNQWKTDYLRSRYGRINDSIVKGWDYIFDYYYTKSGLFEVSPIIKRPFLVKEDIWPSDSAVSGAKYLVDAAGELYNIDAYQYDIVNLFRQVLGQYAGHILYEITTGYQEKDLKKFDKSVNDFLLVSRKLEKLMGSREEFLFGKWVGDSRARASNSKEEELYEWNARAIITTWGGRVLYGYAIKDWGRFI